MASTIDILKQDMHEEVQQLKKQVKTTGMNLLTGKTVTLTAKENTTKLATTLNRFAISIHC